jgi:maleylacetate reductase
VSRPIVRWSLDSLPAVLAEVGVQLPFLVASERWSVDVPVAGRWPEVPSDRIAVPDGVDALLAVGGGSAIDTAKNASAQTGLPVVSVPTTYSGAEWTPGFGIRSPDRRMVGGGGGAKLAAIVYDVGLTLDLPRAETVGTAMNALAHCAEALYVRGRNDAADRRALEGAALIAE